MQTNPFNHDLDADEMQLKQQLETIQDLPGPSPFVKKQLDAAWRKQHARKGLLRHSLPFYQTAAAVVVFLLLGIGIGNQYNKPAKILTKTLVKYVEKPVPVEKTIQVVRYVRIPEKTSTQNAETMAGMEDTPLIAASDSNNVVDYSNGVNFAQDTLFQRMMITLY